MPGEAAAGVSVLLMGDGIGVSSVRRVMTVRPKQVHRYSLNEVSRVSIPLVPVTPLPKIEMPTLRARVSDCGCRCSLARSYLLSALRTRSVKPL